MKGLFLLLLMDVKVISIIVSISRIIDVKSTKCPNTQTLLAAFLGIDLIIALYRF